MDNREEKKKLRRRRRRRMAGLAAFLLAVFSAVVVLCLAIFFKIQTITVTGTERYLAQDIVDAGELFFDQNIFAINKKEVADKIKEQFPYIEEVRVRRALPTTVELELVESKPALVVVNSTQSYTLLSDSGRMIEQCPGVSLDALPLVVGADFSSYPAGSYGDEEVEETLATLKYMLAAIEESGIESINYIDVSDRLSTTLLYDNRVILYLGSELNLSGKLKRAMEILDNQLEEGFTGRLDLSIANRGYSEAIDIDILMNSDYRDSYLKYE